MNVVSGKSSGDRICHNHEFASSLENTLALAIWSRQTRGNSKRAPCSFLLIESTDSTIESTNSMIIVFISMLAL